MTADRRDAEGVACLELERRAYRSRPLHEEPHGLVLGQRLPRWKIACRERERFDRQDLFRLQVERDAGGGEDLHTRTRDEDVRDQVGSLGEDVMATLTVEQFAEFEAAARALASRD